MMGLHQPQEELFSYQVNLEKRVRADHPLRRVDALIDFTFVRKEVASTYGTNGQVSVDPAILLKMMFLLFYENIASERELMAIIPERLDYMWFLGYGLDSDIPNHSVLSKARRRWGRDLFQHVFVRTVQQCVRAGLVEGHKLHVDSSLIDAHASRDSVLSSSPELIAALKEAYQAQESKLEEVTTPEDKPVINDRMLSTTDPDAPLMRQKQEPARPRYHHHRAIDNGCGVITAVETTPGTIAENKKLVGLIEQHEQNTAERVQTVVGDKKYGTAENFVACQQRGITTHLGDFQAAQQSYRREQGLFDESHFTYNKETDTYRCPAGHMLKRRRLHPTRRTWEYHLSHKICGACPLRAQCTRAKAGRSLQRHEQQELLAQARLQAHSAAARRDRRRRQYLMEGSFALAANEHGFKRSRWRRLWRQQVQDYLIAAVQNIRLLLKYGPQRGRAAAALSLKALKNSFRELALAFSSPFQRHWKLKVSVL